MGGRTLLLGVPNSVVRERIAARLLPAVRAALAAVLGMALPVRVVVLAPGNVAATSPPASRHRYPGIGTRHPPNEWQHGWDRAGFPRTVSS